jgi:AraC family L-rhamnose operon transcriptional activator RhaR/AraC family L-rhamnose operon regulatory protein RhaS
VPKGEIMYDFYYADINKYVKEARLPLWVEHIPRGRHGDHLYHDHEFSEIALILHGPAIHLLDKRSAPIKAGDILVIHPGHTHAYDKTGDMELINIVYDPEKLSLPILDRYSLPLFQIFFPSKPMPEKHSGLRPVMSLPKDEIQTVFLKIKSLEEELKSFKPGNFFLSLALFMEILSILARHDANMNMEYQHHFLLGDVIKFMNKNLQRHVSADELVQVSKMSRRNFFRRFKSATGCGPIEYLRQLRLQKATLMLLNSNLTISEIASECGFYDSNYLCHLFRKNMKISPRKFRLSRTSPVK